MKYDIIPGWPDLSEEDIRLFQKNHSEIKADGLLGPKTRAIIWRPREHKANYTWLINYRKVNGGDKLAEPFLRSYLESHPELVEKTGLEIDGIVTLWKIISGNFKTGFQSLFTQDGITLGARRLASSTLVRFFRENRHLSKFFHEDDWKKLLVKRKRSKRRADKSGKATEHREYIPDVNNGFPLDEERMRLSFMELMQSEECWIAQIEEGCQFFSELLEDYPDWTSARLICLTMRAANSKRYGYTYDLSEDNQKKAYKTLKKRYSDTKTHKRRIKKIEKLIAKDLQWRRFNVG